MRELIINKKKKIWLLEKLAENVNKLKQKPYEYFVDRINKEPLTISNGTIDANNFYQIEINVHYDDEDDSAIRVMVSIDNGGWRAFFPLTDSFIIQAD